MKLDFFYINKLEFKMSNKFMSIYSIVLRTLYTLAIYIQYEFKVDGIDGMDENFTCYELCIYIFHDTRLWVNDALTGCKLHLKKKKIGTLAFECNIKIKIYNKQKKKIPTCIWKWKKPMQYHFMDHYERVIFIYFFSSRKKNYSEYV